MKRIDVTQFGEDLYPCPDGARIVNRNTFHNSEQVGPPAVDGRTRFPDEREGTTCGHVSCLCGDWCSTVLVLPDGREMPFPGDAEIVGEFPATDTELFTVGVRAPFAVAHLEATA